MIRIFFLLLLCSISSCSLLKKKGTWGKNSLWPISGSRIGRSLKKNALSPNVVYPLIGAGAFFVSNTDKKVSEWAVREKPIYSNPAATTNWSDAFNNILLYEMYASTVFTPSLEEDKSLAKYAWNKTQGILVVNGASRAASYAHDELATRFKRQRPNKLDWRSCPSGHSTDAGSRNTLVSRNLEYIDMDPNLRMGLNVTNTAMSGAVLWARIEGQRHYPTDVLLGYALGSFVSGFIYDSFIEENPSHSFSILPAKDNMSVRYSISF